MSTSMSTKLTQKEHVTVLGDGAFGTAFATLLAHNGHAVTLWCNNAAVAMSIQKSNRNPRYLPGIELPATITATTELSEALQNDFIFEAIPVQFMRSVLERCKPFLQAEQKLWVSLSKGIEEHTLLLPTQIMQDVLGENLAHAVISGPSYAHELALAQPTGLAIATDNQTTYDTLYALISNEHVVTVPSSDMTGTQMVAALKNVYALTLGLLAGAGHASNAQTLVFMQALEELKLLVKNAGGQESTVYSLAGLGDLILTCFGKTSRNFKLGVLLGQQKTLEAAIQELGTVPEGLNTLKSVMQLTKQSGISMPIAQKTYAIVFENQPIRFYFESAL